MELNKKIDSLLDGLLSLKNKIVFVPVPQMGGSSPKIKCRLEKNERKLVRERYVENRCRRIIFDKSVKINVPYNYQLTADEEKEIDSSIANLSSRFKNIEKLYDSSLKNDVDRIDLKQIALEVVRNDRYKPEVLGMKKPYLNRAVFIWQILWGIMSTYYDKTLALQDDISSQSNENMKKNVFDEIERRLRVIERMRYNVSRHLSDRDISRSGVNRVDKHTLRLFEYPDGSLNLKVGGKGEDYWEKKTGLPADEFFLKDSVKDKPVDAIKSLFKPPNSSQPFIKWWEKIESRNINYCDRVIHSLHLESLAYYISRNTTDPNKYLKDIIDTHPAFVEKLGVYTGPKYPGAIASGLPRSRWETDLFFERLKVKFLDIIPGDHIILLNHPAYYGLSKGAFGLENAIVTKIKGEILPLGFEVQGHGLGPYSFVLMQKDLIEEVKKRLKIAQRCIKEARIWGQSILDRALEKAEKDNPQPYIYNYKEDIITEDFGLGRNFTGNIEFRNELSSLKLGAFWVKWLYTVSPNRISTEEHEGLAVANHYIHKMPSIKELEFDAELKKLTLKGTELVSEKIESIYFINHPHRYLSTNNIWFPGTADHPLHIHSGLEIPKANIMFPLKSEPNYSKQITLIIPDSWIPPRMEHIDPPLVENGNSHYWRPVMRLNFNIDILADDVWFRWPMINHSSAIGTNTAINTAYFPLFEMNPLTGEYDREIKVNNIWAVAKQLQSFYRQSSSDDKILVIRPKATTFNGGSV